MSTNIFESYISKDESSVIKAILMFLIVLGHNMIFTTSLEKYHAMEYLYQFHIQAFFLLPFLYGTKPLTRKRLIDYVIRLYWPFVLLTMVSFLLYYVVYLRQGVDLIGLCKMWLTGDVMQIKQYCGVQIFWFLPAMFSLTIFKDIYYYSNKYIKILLLIVSCCAALLSFLASDYGYYYGIWGNINSIIPFGMLKGISFLVFGVLLRRIVVLLSNHDDWRYVFVVLFVFLSALFFYNAIVLNNTIIAIILKSVFPVLFVLLLWSFRKSVANGCLNKIGRFTFLMYIFHPYIGYVLYFIVKEFAQINLMWALVTQIFMFFGSFYIAEHISRCDRLRIILTPNSVQEVKMLFG